MFVLGTAGHVDHGKSTWLRCLTGQEPDRLPEEKQRGMTIDLNFVWLKTAQGTVGIVDVPGHRKFVKNMISGAMGIDGFLFVLAADDGWMPQSEEHLEVLRSLGVKHGLGILTKTDLVDDSFARLVEEDFIDKMKTAFGSSIPVIRFSAVRPDNLAEIRRRMDELVFSLPPPRDIGSPRVWVDRVFVPKGIGVVTTGTLREGALNVGDEVEILPMALKATVRGLEAYREKKSMVSPVSRVAIQLSKIRAEDVQRGCLIQRINSPPAVSLVDASIETFGKARLKNRELSFHIGTCRELAKVISLGGNFVRLKIKRKVPLRSGDRFILRTSGEERTVGTGTVIDTEPQKTPHRTVIETLKLWDGTVGGFLKVRGAKNASLELVHLARIGIFSRQELEEAVQREPRSPKAAEPLPSPEPELDSRLKEKILGVLRQSPTPTNLKESLVDNPFKQAVWRLVKLKQVVSLGDDHFIESNAFDEFKKKVLAYLSSKGSATTSELRGFLNVSRKNAVMLLERMDQDRATYLKDGVRRVF